MIIHCFEIIAAILWEKIITIYINQAVTLYVPFWQFLQIIRMLFK